MASAKEAGFTVVVNVYRANELATLLSAVAMEENTLKRTNSSPDTGEDYSADEMCYPPSEWWNDSSLQTNFSSLPEKFERQRADSQWAGSRRKGRACDHECDVRRRCHQRDKGCDVGKAVVDFYNKNSRTENESGWHVRGRAWDDAQTIMGSH